MSLNQPSPAPSTAFRQRALLLVSILGLMWFLELIDVAVLGQALNGLGLRPRQIDGLWGIILMPFLHGGLGHLAANSIPFLVLGGLVLWRRLLDFLIVTAFSTLLTGAILWTVGSVRAIYIGASGLVFGYFGFLVFRSYFERSPQSLLVALIVVVLYGGLLLGVLPQGNGISWEAHLFGFLSGALCARILSRRAVAHEPPLIVISSEDD